MELRVSDVRRAEKIVVSEILYFNSVKPDKKKLEKYETIPPSFLLHWFPPLVL